MDAEHRSIQDVTFRFDERVQRGDFPAETVSGTVKYRQPHALRVDQKGPNAQRLISDGATFWLYSAAQKQEVTGDWPTWVQQSHFPLPLLEWAGTLSPDHWKSRYTVLFGGYRAPEYELHFKPLLAGDAPLTLWISEQTFLPVRGAMQLDGTSIQVTLHDIRLNSGLAASVFTSRVPAGTERIPLHF